MATSSERQNVCKQHGIVRTSLFCAIVLALLIVPKGASAQNGVAVVPSTAYPCSLTGIQNAVAAAQAVFGMHPVTGITQPVVDASNCTSMTFTSEMDIGTGSGPAGDPTQRIKFILPANGTWTANITGGTSYALKWGDGVEIYGGTGSGEGQPFGIVAGSGSDLLAVCGNDDSGNAPYFHAEGFACSANSGATIRSAVLLINGGNDESYVGHMNASANGATFISPARVFWVHAACCSATIEDINADANFTANAPSCAFGDFNAAIHISKISCVHPGSGQNAVQIFQSGGSSNNGVGSTYKDIYMEQGASASDTTTPYVEVKHLSGTFAAADVLDGFRAGVDVSTSTRCMIDIASDGHGGGGRVNVMNLSLGDNSTCAINDHVNGSTINGAVNSVIASYDMSPRYSLVLGPMTVSTLPSPTSTNRGTMFMVTDSTNTAEGQVCTSGTGGVPALAFSNGTNWKCFF